MAELLTLPMHDSEPEKVYCVHCHVLEAELGDVLCLSCRTELEARQL